MKHLLYIDFETFYSTNKADRYDLKSLSIVQYVRSPRFKAFGMGVAEADKPPKWIPARAIGGYLERIADVYGWPNVAVVGHNIKFDAFILREIYEVVPGQYIDTKGMSKAVLGKSVKGHSLQLLAEHFQLPAKGIMKTDGLGEKEDLSAAEEQELAEYCLHDVELCREVYSRLAKEFPENEYAALHRTVSMFVSPKLQLNVPLLLEASRKEAERRANIFEEIRIPKADFASNVKFPALLASKGYEVPTKPSPRKKDENGDAVQIPALALGDPEFLEMLEGENEELKTLCEARVAAKSTLLETRSAKLAAIGATGLWPFDVEFSGADQTHRFSGGSGAGGNPQNFTRGSALRTAVEAPSGCELVVGDFSNIELRLVAYLSKDPGLVQAIEKGVDIYCDFASVFYGRKITKADARERRFGKCLAEGTLVLCESGWTRIELITENDRVWDGEEWATHQGLVDNGVKEVIGLDGLWLTPDHRILCETEWKEAQSVVPDENLRYLALAKGSGKLPLQAILKVPGTASSRYSGYVTAEVQNGTSISRTSRPAAQHGATCAPKNQQELIENSIGATPMFLQTMVTEPGFLTVCLLRLVGATIRLIGLTNITERGESLSTKSGGQTEGLFSSMFKHFRDGTCRALRWTGQMLIKGTNLETSGLFPATITCVTSDGSETLRPKMRVYDLLSAGPRNRFTVLTAAGPLIVHNCAILGLGYGMGWKKFIKTVRVQAGQMITEGDSQKAVELYRTRYSKVPALWDTLSNLIPIIASGYSQHYYDLPVDIMRQAIKLPSGLLIRYPNLRQEKGERGHSEWVYDVYNKRKLEKRKLYGAKIVENITQGLAGELTKTAMNAMGDAVVMQVHDELGVICRKGLGLVTTQKLKRVMTKPPDWMPNIKLEVEVGVGKNWNEAK